MTEENDKGEEIYSEEGREKLVESDSIEPWEEGFMEGADSDGQKAKCRKCGKENGDVGLEKFKSENPDLVLLDLRMPGTGGTDVIRQVREVNGEVYWFCSDECSEKYAKDNSK